MVFQFVPKYSTKTIHFLQTMWTCRSVFNPFNILTPLFAMFMSYVFLKDYVFIVFGKYCVSYLKTNQITNMKPLRLNDLSDLGWRIPLILY
jgi:hypothetical protein